jgi:hypothetical protein
MKVKGGVVCRDAVPPLTLRPPRRSQLRRSAVRPLEASTPGAGRSKAMQSHYLSQRATCLCRRLRQREAARAMSARVVGATRRLWPTTPRLWPAARPRPEHNPVLPLHSAAIFAFTAKPAAMFACVQVGTRQNPCHLKVGGLLAW